MTTSLVPVSDRGDAIKRAPLMSQARRRRADGTARAFFSCRRKKFGDGHAAIAYGDGRSSERVANMLAKRHE